MASPFATSSGAAAAPPGGLAVPVPSGSDDWGVAIAPHLRVDVVAARVAAATGAALVADLCRVVADFAVAPVTLRVTGARAAGHFGGRDGGCAQATFHKPYGLALWPAGRALVAAAAAASSSSSSASAAAAEEAAATSTAPVLLVADAGNCRARVVDTAADGRTYSPPGFPDPNAPYATPERYGAAEAWAAAHPQSLVVPYPRPLIVAVQAVAALPGGSSSYLFAGPHTVWRHCVTTLAAAGPAADAAAEEVDPVTHETGPLRLVAGSNRIAWADGVGLNAAFAGVRDLCVVDPTAAGSSGGGGGGARHCFVADAANRAVRHIDLWTKRVSTVLGARAADPTALRPDDGYCPHPYRQALPAPVGRTGPGRHASATAASPAPRGLAFHAASSTLYVTTDACQVLAYDVTTGALRDIVFGGDSSGSGSSTGAGGQARARQRAGALSLHGIGCSGGGASGAAVVYAACAASGCIVALDPRTGAAQLVPCLLPTSAAAADGGGDGSTAAAADAKQSQPPSSPTPAPAAGPFQAPRSVKGAPNALMNVFGAPPKATSSGGSAASSSSSSSVSEAGLVLPHGLVVAQLSAAQTVAFVSDPVQHCVRLVTKLPTRVDL